MVGSPPHFAYRWPPRNAVYVTQVTNISPGQYRWTFDVPVSVTSPPASAAAFELRDSTTLVWVPGNTMIPDGTSAAMNWVYPIVADRWRIQAPVTNPVPQTGTIITPQEGLVT